MTETEKDLKKTIQEARTEYTHDHTYTNGPEPYYQCGKPNPSGHAETGPESVA
jgi:hypothetical protein